ncbi:MAG: S8 family serine peptidase [Chthoniobacterales bacterium]|nr:S8 family serine peptidase [Chthoniobacterales bacterium]
MLPIFPQVRPLAAVVFASALALAAVATPRASQPTDTPDYAPDRVIVKLHGTSSDLPLGITRALVATDWKARLGLPPGMTLQSMGGPLATRSAAQDAPDLSRPIVLHLNGQATVPEILARLRGHPDVEFVEPDYVAFGSGRPSDPNYALQWHHQKIQAEAAWDISTGSRDVIVAVLDSGINASLAEFSGRIIPGHDYANNDSNPADDYGHGTAVAGVIAANANNGVFGAGVNWRCRILAEKIFDNRNRGYYSWWDQAIYDATDAGAKVINLSGGGSADSAATVAAIDYAISHGVIFVTITGNDSAGVIQFPGRLPQCITLGGTERNDARASFSNYGPSIDLVAPARDIYTVGKDGSLEYWYGTSFAAPQVSGVAAIAIALDPSLNQRKMEQLLRATAEDQIGGVEDTPGRDSYFGFGRLNARFAVQLAATRSPPPQPINLSSRMRVGLGDKAMIGGFIVTGAHAKNTLVRAIGPSLKASGVRGTLEDPAVDLFDSRGTLLASNDNWAESQPREIMASGLAPSDRREAAIERILSPGAYTARVRGTQGGQGVALVEVYDLQQTRNSKLANVSTRGSVELGDNVMIGGFIVGSASNYVVRAIGPSLRDFGLSAALDDPTLELRDGDGRLVAANDNWADDPNAGEVQTAGLAPSNPGESAARRRLAAGNYTIVVRGVNGSTGVGLVEVYNVP